VNRLFAHWANIEAEKLKPYFPAGVRQLPAGRVAIERPDESQAVFTVALSHDLIGGALVIPTLSFAAGSSHGYRCALRVSAAREAPLTPVGEWAVQEPDGSARIRGVKPAIDCFAIGSMRGEAELIFRVVAADVDGLLHRPYLLTISIAASATPDRLKPPGPASFQDISVPPKSQMEYDPAIRRRICSPTCVSMVLDYLGRRTSPLVLAAHAYNAEHDLYGVWPSNIWAATRYHVLGYVHRFAGFSEAKRLLDNGVPVIASISYRAGELRNAAVKSTRGHLVVLRGYRRHMVIVNDPAAPSEALVHRLYSRDEFLQAWLGHRGIGYVLVPAEGREGVKG